MATVAKPPVTTHVFADSASGSPDIASPPYMDTGFPLTAGPGTQPVKPPRGYINWLFNYCMSGVRYLFQRGITDWDSAEDGYAPGAVVRSGDGNLYQLTGTPTTATPPHTDQNNWFPVARDKAVNDGAGGLATSFDGPSNPAAWNDLLTNPGAPISGLDKLPTFASASGFAVTIGAGIGFINTSVGLGANESTYRSIAWPSGNVTHSAPDPTNPRIDAITVTPQTYGTPSTIAVVAGTPAATPLPAAVPAGSAALFYVFVPAAASDSTAFRACRGLWRRVGYPWAGMSGVISGCELSWDYTADPGAATAQVYLRGSDQTTGLALHRILIDGEPIEWNGLAIGGGGIVSDSTADPFGSAASGSFDRPYYFYAAGGRHNPLPHTDTFGTALNPVTIVESTVPPNVRTGKPTANLTVNGQTVTPNGAVYIGLGFVVQGTTRRRACVMDAEMTCGLNPLQFLPHTFLTTTAEDLGTFGGGAAPDISTRMRINAALTAPTAQFGTVFIRLENFPVASGFGGLNAGLAMTAPAAGNATLNGATIEYTAWTGAELWAILNTGGAVAGATLQIAAMGFNHRVNRICVGF